MARYDAQINLLVSGQRELDRLADRLRSIEKQIVDINRLGVSPQQRDPVTGRFGADPDRQNRVRLAGIQRIAREEERRSRLTSARLRGQNAELERSILLQSRLNSAVDLYERKLEELSRGGGGAKLSESLRGQIRDIQAAYDAATAGGTKNLSIVRSLATELGRVVERQNEINRLSSFQSKSFFDTQRFERRIAELRRAGVAASEFGGVGRQIRELRSAQARGSEFEAKDVSRRIKESLDRIARELDDTIRQAKIENTARRAARSWEKFFEDAGANSLRLRQNQNDAVAKFRGFFEDAAAQALQVSQNAKETRRSWQSFFEDAATQALQISQNAKNTKESWQSFFVDAASQALQIGQNAKDTRRSWQEFFEDAQKEADRLREGRLSKFARLRGRPDQYGVEAGPLPSGGPGSPRYLQEARQLSNELLDVEAQIGRIRQESLNESLRLETKRLSLAKEYKRQVADALLEAVTFGRGSQVKRVAKDIATGGQNALVRGGLGLGALGISGAYVGAQEALSNLNFGPLQGQAVKAADAIGNAINSSLGGIPEIVNQMLSALGNVPSSLGLATVAALAFAPAMKTAGDAVFLAGKKFGQTKFGENVKLTLDRQTNLFESAINAASQMTMPIDASGFERNLEVRQSGKETVDSWRSFFEEAAYFGLQLKQDSKDAASKWADFFKSASYQALQISQNSKNTRKSWQTFFEDAAYEAFSIRQGSKDTSSSWRLFFENAAYEALLIRQNSKKTAEAWRSFFEEAAYQAFSIRQKSKEAAESWGVFFADAAAQGLEIKQNLKKTADSWRAFFLDAASETLRISQEAKNTANNWKQFFETAAYQALQIKQNGKETSESWKVFFEDAAYEAFSIKEKAKLTRSSWERFFEEAKLEAKRLRGGSETGLQGSLKKLQEARGARQAFLGDVSPAQAIDKIVREFNQGKPAQNITDTFASGLKKGAARVASSAQSFAMAATQAIKDVFGIASPSRFMIEIVQNLVSTYIAEMQKSYPRIQAATARAFGEEELVRPVRSLRATSRGFEFVNRPSRGFRPFREAQGFGRETAGASREFNNMMLDFRKQIAELTTQPEIYSNLLRGLPNSRITTDLAGAASRRALAAELPSFLPVQRMMGPGELEREIAKAFADYVRTIRTPDPWVGLVGDYREFIDKVIAQTQRLSSAQLALPGTRIAGALPAAEQRITSAQQQRIQRAYERSAQRQLAVFSGDAFAGTGRPALSATNFGFMADPARIGRLSGIGRALPPAVDVAASAADAGGRDLQGTVRQLFDRIAAGVRRAVGGIGGGGGFGGGVGRGGGAAGGGRGGSAAQVAQLLGLDALADVSRVSTRELEALSGIVSEFRAVLDPTIEGFDRLDDQLRETIANLDRQVERRAPDAGFLTRQFGPRTARGLSEGLIGGAFPLLFGQGIGAAVGGGAGGFAGGFAGGGLGFGLSLVGTALGTAFDTAVQGATELGTALNDSAATFDKVKERALFSSKEAERLGDKLQELGFVASAAILSQQEVISKIGVSGVNSLSQLGDSSDRLNRVWAEFNLQLQAALAGPMAGLLEWVADIVGIANQRGRSQAAARDLIPQDEAGRKRFEQELTATFNKTYGTGFSGPGTPRGSIEDTIKFLSFDEKGRAALAELSKKFPPVELDVTIKKSQEIEEQIAVLSKRLEVIDIGKSLKDQVRSAAREQQDLDKQRADLVRSYEESIGNIRKQVEDEIRNKRFATLEKENQLLDIQGQIRLKQLQIANQAAISQAGVGQRPEVEQAAKEVAQLVAQFTEQQVSAEEEAASIKRNAALEVQKIDSEAAQFKANIEKEVSRLNIETARRVADINEQVRRRNEEFDGNRFKLEKRIAQLQLKNNEILTNQQLDTAQKNLTSAQKANDTQQAAYARSVVDIYQAQLDIIQKGQKDIAAISAPSVLRGVGAVGGGGVSTAGLDRATADYKTAVSNYVAAELRLNQLNVVQNAQEFALGILDFANKTDAMLTAIQTRESDAEIERLRYIELINIGLTDTVAQKVIELESTKRVALAVYDTAIAQLESKIIAGEVTAEVDAQNRAYLDQIDILKRRKDALEGRFGEINTGTGKKTGVIGGAVESDRGKKLQDFIAQATAELNDLEAVAVRVSQGIGDAVANSMVDGITGLIEGTTTAKEVFAGFLKDMGDILIREGTRMIAMYIAIGVAKIFAGLLSGGSGGGAKKPALPGSMGQATKTGLNTGAGNISDMLSGLAADGAYFTNGAAAFANGGMFTNSIVSSPTLFKFADGGAMRTGVMGEAGPEAIMPLERGADGKLGVSAKLSGAMTRYGRSTGGDVVAGAGVETTDGAAGSATAPIDVRYSVERINNVDYVTADQFQRGMEQAAKQGAALGKQQVYSELANKRSLRSRLAV